MADPETSNRFVVDEILPAREIHLIAGPPGAGKTTLALQILNDWTHGREVLGRRSFPAPHCYVACDRSAESLRSHMRRLGLDPLAFPHLSMVGKGIRAEERTLASAYDRAQRLVPDAIHVLFLDGISFLCRGKIADDRDVSQFMCEAIELCHTRNLTIIGCIRAVKAKGDDSGYLAPRDRILGSGAWASMSQTKILIDPLKPSKIENPYRTLSLLPHAQPAQSITMVLGEGGLTVGTDRTQDEGLNQWLVRQESGTELAAAQIQDVARDVGVSRAGAFRWISDQLELGTLVKAGYGIYRVPPPLSVQ